ncbi:MAG TPA: nucleotide exchange factor GrpE [Acidimicrobiales bacterium]|nr:nucleotide exchange factor GrpE [Acidimicrobiales bacterium]
MSDPTETHPVAGSDGAATGGPADGEKSNGAAAAPEEEPEVTEPTQAENAEAREAEVPEPAEAPGAEAQDAEATVESAELDLLSVALRERDDYLDALKRMQADFENYKKRVAKQQADSVARAAEALVDKLLPALDTADLAVAHVDSDEVRQVRGALIDALEREGLERIAPEGAPFDPTRHEAVAHEPGDGGQQVAEVLRAGYAWKGRVLRPAMVKVRG